MARLSLVCGQLLTKDHTSLFQTLNGIANTTSHTALQLPHDNHGASTRKETFCQLVLPQAIVHKVNATLNGKLTSDEVEQRLAYWHIDMHRFAARLRNCAQYLVHQTIAIPAFYTVVRFWQAHFLGPKSLQGLLLRHGLPLELTYHRLWSVCRHHYYRHMLVACLHHCRQGVYHCRARRDAHHHGFSQGLRLAQGHESRRTLIGHRLARHARSLTEVVGDGRIA